LKNQQNSVKILYYQSKMHNSIYLFFVKSSGIFFLILILVSQVHSQGCSDAGFCTMGAMRPNQAFGRNKNIRVSSVEVGSNIGYTKFKDLIISNVIDVTVGVSTKSTLQVRLPYTFVHGKLGNTHGLGDISLSYTYSVAPTEKYRINFSGGAKIPTSNSDIFHDSLPLPMYYQTSLGTFDFITGLSITSQKWMLAAGYQMPVVSINGNDFRWAAYNNAPSDVRNIALQYPQSWNLKRGTDVMLRLERNVRFSRLNFFAGALAIYRLNKDVIDKSQVPVLVRGAVVGSDGLVVNGLFGGGYQFSARSGIKILVGVKLRAREKNPDGLSREEVANISYIVKF
jgi:hypothetical protein